MLGAEVHFTLKGVGDLGHKSLLLFGSNEQLADLYPHDLQPIPGSTTTQLQDCANIAAYMQRVRDELGDALLMDHHPATTTPMATNWDCADQGYGPAVEIYSEHGNSDRLSTDFDALWSDAVGTSTVAYALTPAQHGLRLGIFGGTDTHDTQPGSVCDGDTLHPHHPYGGGLTVVVADEHATFDRPAIHDAFVQRRTYATSGPLIPAVVEYSSEGELLGGMGEEIALDEPVDIDIQLRVPAELASYVLEVRLHEPEGSDFQRMTEQGDGVWAYTMPAEGMLDYLWPVVVVDGERWYSGQDCADGGDTQEERLWLSPTWFDLVSGLEDDLDGDGWTVEDGDCDDEDAGINPEATESCAMPGDEDCDGLVNEEDEDCSASGDTGFGSEPERELPMGDTAEGDPAVPEPPGRRFGQCASAGAGAAGWYLLFALAWLRRRRVGAEG